MELTPFGKIVRKLRIDAGVTLKQMADFLDVSSAFLSGVELGRKKIPDSFPQRISDFLKKSGILEELKTAADISRNEFNISLRRTSSERDRVTALMFAREFENISDNEKEEILNILKRNR